MKCSNINVPGMEQTSKVKNPGLAVKVEKDISEKERAHLEAMRPFGVTSLDEMYKWREKQPPSKFPLDDRIKERAKQRLEEVTYTNERGTRSLDEAAYERTQPSWREFTSSVSPIKPIGSLPDTPTFKEMAMALNPNKISSGLIVTTKNKADGKHRHYIPDGTITNSRLDIPSYLENNQWLVSIKSKAYKGTKYGQVAHMRNVTFPVTPSERIAGIRIAAGEMGKSPYATMSGEWVNTSAPKARNMAKDALKSDEWVEIGMNPYRDVDFYRKDTGERIYGADEIVQIGPLVMAKGVINNTMIDVIPNDMAQRDGVVQDIGNKLAVGGKAFINVRALKGDADKDELVEYLQDTLGGGFVVTESPLGTAGALITKVKEVKVGDIETARVFNNTPGEFTIILPGAGEIVLEKGGKYNSIDGEWSVETVGLSDEFKGKGLGVKLYLKAVEELLKMGEYRASYLSSGGMTTESAMRVWRSLYRNKDKYLKDFPQLKNTFTMFNNERGMIVHDNGTGFEKQYEQDVGDEPAYSIELYPDMYAKNIAKQQGKNR